MTKTPVVTVVDVEISPVERSLGVAYLSDVQLEAGETLRPGDRLVLRDEGGYRYAAVTEEVTPGAYGNRYKLSIAPE